MQVARLCDQRKEREKKRQQEARAQAQAGKWKNLTKAEQNARLKATNERVKENRKRKADFDPLKLGLPKKPLSSGR